MACKVFRHKNSHRTELVPNITKHKFTIALQYEQWPLAWWCAEKIPVLRQLQMGSISRFATTPLMIESFFDTQFL